MPARYAGRQAAGPGEPMIFEGLTKSEAEELLDWLEANGCPNREVTQSGDQGFTVRCW